MAIPTREELDDLIRERLAADPAFRDALLADPRGTVSALVGVDLPDLVTVEVHEESLTSVHLVLPPSPTRDALSDDDLELVAGGGVCWMNVSPCCQ